MDKKRFKLIIFIGIAKTLLIFVGQLIDIIQIIWLSVFLFCLKHNIFYFYMFLMMIYTI